MIDTQDVCSFGHQLVPGSDPITIREYGDSGQILSEETRLLRRHAPYGSAKSVSRLDVNKVVAFPCPHALAPSELLEDELPEYQGFRGESYGRGHWLTYEATYVGEKRIPILKVRCPVCRGEAAPVDWRA